MHAFARFIQILGKGRNGMRSLTQEEAYEAMKMIADNEVEPEQLGAFLMLMRVKEETAQEVAGFTAALRECMPSLEVTNRPAIDWAAYAGKKRHLPWFILAALILSARGYPVLMHGMYRRDERIYAPDVLNALGLSPATSIPEAQVQLNNHGFAYLDIANFSPVTAKLIATREQFGLRPPLHTVARMLNPCSAPLSLMGVFHPNFSVVHQQAAVLLEQPQALICKGEGGEFERIPDRAVKLFGVNDGKDWLETWDTLIKPGSEIKPERLDLDLFRAVWQGEAESRYGQMAVSGTLALVIRALGIEIKVENAQQLALTWWQERHQFNQTREAS